MRRGALGALIFAAAAWGQPPVERWLEGAPRADIKWSVRAGPVRLSRFQRLHSRLSIQINGDEIVRRRGHGRLLMIIELRDNKGRRYHDQRLLDLRKPPFTEAANLARADWAAAAFVTPGDYEVTFALADLATGEHDLARKKLHVAPLSGDPLPRAWRDLPPVEFIDSSAPPDSWYLPEIASRLALPVETGRRVRVEIVMNTSASETSRRAQRRTDQTVALLLPELKALSQIQLNNGTLNVTLFDVARRREVFRQDAVSSLDWNRLRSGLATDNQNLIDAAELKDRGRNVQFFLSEVGRRIAPAGDGVLHVVIVLSAPMSFPSGTDRTPIELSEDSDIRLFYVRHETLPATLTVAGTPLPPSSARQYDVAPAEAQRGPSTTLRVAQQDQLEDTFKPLHPRAFDVWTPLEFRKALAAILREISAN